MTNYNYKEKLAEKRIENLFEFIELTANSIFADTDLPQVKEILYENKALTEEIPSRASAAVFALCGIRGSSEEMRELLDSLEAEIFKDYSDKKIN